MTDFKAYQVTQTDAGVKGSLNTVNMDDLSEGEIVIRTAYSSVNYKDALAATGQGKIIRRFPLIGGIDVAGYVESSDSDVFNRDDPVLVTGYDLGTNHDGGYAEYVRVPADWVIPIPDGLTPYTAMALGTAGFTVALCIKRLEENGQSPEKGPFVVTGATGGVGMFAIDILSGMGYEVIAVTGKDESHDELLSLGAQSIIDRKSINFDGPPLEKAQWGGAIDNVGGDILAWLTRTVKPWGNIASIGLASGSNLNTTVMPFILRGVSLIGITSAGCPPSWRQGLWQRLATDLAPRHLEKIVTREVGLEDLPRVFDEMLAGKTQGRTVVKISTEC